MGAVSANRLSSRGTLSVLWPPRQEALVAIQLDCFVVPAEGTSRNDGLETWPGSIRRKRDGGGRIARKRASYIINRTVFFLQDDLSSIA